MNLTLRQVFLFTLAALALLLGGLFYLLLNGSQRSVIQSAAQLREEAGLRIGNEFVAYLSSAEKVLADVENQLRYGGLSVDDPAAVEAALYNKVRSNPGLAQVTLTYAEGLVYDKDGVLERAVGNRWQISVYRVAGDERRIVTRRVLMEGDRFVTESRDRGPTDGLLDVAMRRSNQPATDPTNHLTFRTMVDQDYYGQQFWSDLHLSQLDSPVEDSDTQPTTDATGGHRVEVTVQKAIEEPPKKPADPGNPPRFLGVVRVGLLTEQLDQMCERHLAGNPNDPHRIFVCDPRGRLITRVSPNDRIDTSGEDVRVIPHNLPPEIGAALKLPVIGNLKHGETAPGEVTAGGRRYLVTFRALEEERAQDWIVGILAPEDYYLRGLLATRNRLLVASLAVMVAIFFGGAAMLRLIQTGLNRVVTSAARMQNYDFTSAATKSPFRDVRAVMESLEKAKTAMRAMGKYVPVDLVRRLYQMNREPTLGGDQLDVTIMFTDIKGFTSLAEKMAPDPDRLAALLGEYFAAMTAAVHANEGIVDKFIGDAVMGLWNVPTPVKDHPIRACAAAMGCLRATRTLNESPSFRELPPLVTRIGLNRGTAMVGHFGAPDRMGYTALGDEVNLASRLEGLNKEYGTLVLATEPVRDAAAGAFRFRLLDRVVVTGKTRGVRIYELRGPASDADPQAGIVERYEMALAAYWARDFAAAESTLAAQVDVDPPSRVLAQRCRDLAGEPPPPEWDGVFVARMK